MLQTDARPTREPPRRNPLKFGRSGCRGSVGASRLRAGRWPPMMVGFSREPAGVHLHHAGLGALFYWRMGGLATVFVGIAFAERSKRRSTVRGDGCAPGDGCAGVGEGIQVVGVSAN